MRYQEAIDFIYNLELFGIKMGLDNITRFLQHLGNPQSSYKTIHVGGTNGKGSVASMLYSVLREAGYSAGVFTSPHLVDYRERVRVDGFNIDKRSIAQFVGENKKFIEDARITFFEISTALALWYFHKCRVDVAVVEVGLGGRLDATNVLQPAASIITNVDFDHTKILGNTLEKIAIEKAGIIKQGVPLITGEGRREILKLFRDVCAERGTTLVRAARPRSPYRERNSTMQFEFAQNGSKPISISSPLMGPHQQRNIGVVVKCVEVLRSRGWKISDAALRRGIRNSRWPARFQLVCRRPRIILDVAHNLDGTRQLVASFMQIYPGKRVLLVCGILQRPDHDKIMLEYAPIVRRAIITRPDTPRAAEIEGVIWAAVNADLDFDVKFKVADAVDRALKLAQPDDIILMSGSHFTLGEAITRLHHLRDRGKLNLIPADITLMNDR